MTTTACLPECRPSSGSPYTGEFWPAWHAPLCPNGPRAPQAEDGGKVEGYMPNEGCLLDCRADSHNPNCTAPAPVSDKGAEVEPVTEAEADKSTLRILRALLAEAEAERDEARATKDMHKERQEEAWAERDAIRAQLATADQNLKTMLQAAGEEAERQLAAAKEEIAKLEQRSGCEHCADKRREVEDELASLKAEIPARMLRFPQRRLAYQILSLEHELAAEKAARDRAEARVKELEAAGNRVVKHRNRHYRDVRDSVDMLERVLATRKEGESR